MKKVQELFSKSIRNSDMQIQGNNPYQQGTQLYSQLVYNNINSQVSRYAAAFHSDAYCI